MTDSQSKAVERLADRHLTCLMPECSACLLLTALRELLTALSEAEAKLAESERRVKDYRDGAAVEAHEADRLRTRLREVEADRDHTEALLMEANREIAIGARLIGEHVEAVAIAQMNQRRAEAGRDRLRAEKSEAELVLGWAGGSAAGLLAAAHNATTDRDRKAEALRRYVGLSDGCDYGGQETCPGGAAYVPCPYHQGRAALDAATATPAAECPAPDADSCLLNIDGVCPVHGARPV